MIDSQTWLNFRHKIRDIRLSGKQVKYIGRSAKASAIVSGVPIAGTKIFVDDIVLDARNFVSLTHLKNAFSVDGKIISEID